jgi:hypothetical protein
MNTASPLRSEVTRLARRWKTVPVGIQFDNGFCESELYAEELVSALEQSPSDVELSEAVGGFIEKREAAERDSCAFARALRATLTTHGFPAPPAYQPPPDQAPGLVARVSRLFRR